MRAPRLGPPKDLDPAEAWMRMTELPRPVSEPVALRARGVAFAAARFWVPTPREIATLNARARRAAVLGSDDELLRATLLLRLVARDPFRVAAPLFRSEAEVGALTPAEIGAALDRYYAFRVSCGPVVARLSPEELEAWIELLRRGAEVLSFEATRWGGSNTPYGVPGVDPENLCDCHFLSWMAARRVLYPDAARPKQDAART